MGVLVVKDLLHVVHGYPVLLLEVQAEQFAGQRSQTFVPGLKVPL